MVTTRANTYGSVGMLQRRKRRLPSGPRTGSKRKNAFATNWRERAPRKRATVTSTVRRKRRGSRIISREYAYKKSRIYTSRKPRRNLDRPWQVHRLQGVKLENPNEDNGNFVPGFFAIDKPDITTTYQELPVYVAKLSCINNTFGNGPAALYRMSMSDNGAMLFNQVNTQDENAASTTSFWRPEKNYLIQEGILNTNYVQREWLDVRLKLYGCRRQDVTYDIFLVSFKLEELCPDDPTVSALENNYTLRQRFWQELVRPCVTNTILPGNYNWKRHVNILRAKRIVLKAKESTDLETNPDSVDLKWYIRGGKRVLYAESADYFISDSAVMNVGWKPTTSLRVLDEPVYPRDRQYLIIRATDMETRNIGVNGNDDPSFDMVLRRKMKYFGTCAT